jgi:anti-sigma factor RsiW
MSIPDETLMAFADGELDPVTRDAVESAIREDPHLQLKVAEHRALRQRVESAYAAELDGRAGCDEHARPQCDQSGGA